MSVNVLSSLNSVTHTPHMIVIGTPWHMIVIGKESVVASAFAIDNSPNAKARSSQRRHARETTLIPITYWSVGIATVVNVTAGIAINARPSTMSLQRENTRSRSATSGWFYRARHQRIAGKPCSGAFAPPCALI